MQAIVISVYKPDIEPDDSYDFLLYEILVNIITN